MEEGDYFAIETFGSTGRGRVIEEGACSHYALSQDRPERYSLPCVPLTKHVTLEKKLMIDINLLSRF
jgi:methionine aminopeptidase